MERRDESNKAAANDGAAVFNDGTTQADDLLV